MRNINRRFYRELPWRMCRAAMMTAADEGGGGAIIFTP